MKEKKIIKGRGAQLNTKNPYQKNEYGLYEIEGIDVEPNPNQKTQYFFESPKKIVNKVTSTDLGMEYSINPYQGCEHGCIYCYARNTHQYWGFSAGMDFEQKIIVKKDAAKLLKKQLRNPKWEVKPIMLSGNTDCYQPAEREFKITRQLLEVLLEFKHPVSIITKNALILRDLDLLEALNKHQLVSVNLSITSLDENIRRKLEPRTVSGKKRMEVVKTLSEHAIPVNIMVAPIIPGLNSHEIPEIIKAGAFHGALSAAYTIVRLNGAVGDVFTDWVYIAFPNSADKIIRQVKECHGGQLNDSRMRTRIIGEGVVAKQIRDLFKLTKAKYMKGRYIPKLNQQSFVRNGGTQLNLW